MKFAALTCQFSNEEDVPRGHDEEEEEDEEDEEAAESVLRPVHVRCTVPLVAHGAGFDETRVQL